MHLRFNCLQHGVATNRSILILSVLAVIAVTLAVVYIPKLTSQPRTPNEDAANGDDGIETIPVQVWVSTPAPEEGKEAIEEEARLFVQKLGGL